MTGIDGCTAIALIRTALTLGLVPVGVAVPCSNTKTGIVELDSIS